METIKFKYYPNVCEQDIFTMTAENEMLECECCGKKGEFFGIIYLDKT